ncbi:MAG: hypothetical protein L6437_15915 [Kiritimatiellae bacterium]|nr:hypothetical protein [Kiritimatiellia bacterium]
MTATVSTRQGAAPKEKAATFHVYTQAGEKPACDEEVAKMRMSFSKYALFVDAPEGRVHVYGRPCKLSPLQFALTVDRLKNFWRSADIDDVVHWAWTENGLGRNPKDSVTALRSACHDLNRNIGRPRLIFLQVVDRRVKWRTHFPFCLITEKNRINTNQQEIMATDRE